MKVQIITSLYPLPWDPNREVFNRQQFEHLAEWCQVKVLVVVPWLVAFRHRKELRRHVCGRVEVDYVWFFGMPKVGRFLNAALLFPSLLLKYLSFRKYRPDCFLLTWAFPDSVAGAALARLMRIPFLIKVHGSDVNMHCRYAMRAAQVVWAMEKASAVLSVSRDLADSLARMGVSPGKIHVVYNGVNRGVFHSLPKPESRARVRLSSNGSYVLYVGNLKREKGCVDLLEAFIGLAKVNAQVELYYIGTGKMAEGIRARAQAAGLGDRVHLLGSVGHDKLVHWVNACDVLSLPSHSEGLPNVLLEAMSCGVPVVATRVGGVPEIVPPEAGITVALGDPQALSEALGKALENDWDRESIVRCVKDFTWENSASRIHQLLLSAQDVPEDEVKPIRAPRG